MEDFFEKRKQQFSSKLRTVKSEANRYSIFRGISFILCLLALIGYFQDLHAVFLIVFLLLGVAFYFLVLHHRKLETKVNYYGVLLTFNSEEIQRQRLELESFETGAEFLEKDHPYQQDLDILGRSSLYQLVNRCQLPDSKAQLAHWLSGPAPYKEIRSRQEAVEELAQHPDWIQDFMATVRLQLDEKEKRAPSVNHEDISAWTKKTVNNLRPRLWQGVSLALSLLFLLNLVVVILGLITYHSLYPLIIINMIFLGIGLKKLNLLIRGIDKSHYLISSYKEAIVKLEKSTFASGKLTTLRNNLLEGTETASRSISILASLTNRIASRTNMLYALLDVPLLLDVHLLADLYRWKTNHKEEIDTWFETIHKLECLISLAGFRHSYPEYCFPEITEDAFHFTARELGHPLIPKNEKVTNSYSITGEGKVDIITGSNMSGKSTFQRTVGINMVLAQTGAPVDASHLSMGITPLFTSMRTRDNLAENTSSFYAELKRIHQLLVILDQQDSTFFLLDEILKGTNSADRHQGAIALVKKLTGKKGFGMVSTHDLALAELETSNPKVRNLSFNSTIEGDEIRFDYLLTPGPCRSFNASKLMEKMGIM